jgi:hypothetical protein
MGKAGTKKKAIIVLGMHRSGTSAITRVLGLLGAQLPKNLMPANPANEAGYWESMDLYSIHEEMLSSAGTAWDDILPFPEAWYTSEKAEQFQQRILSVLRKDFNAAQLYVIKDPRISRLMPLWLRVLREFKSLPHVVISVRHPLEVVASLKQRDNVSRAKTLLLWLRHLLEAERATRGQRRSFVSYDALLNDWHGVTNRISRELSITWQKPGAKKRAEITAFVSSNLRHYSYSEKDLDEYPEVGRWVKKVYSAVRRASQGDVAGLARAFDGVRHEIENSDVLYAPIMANVRAEAAHTRTQLVNEAATRQQELSELRAAITQRETRVAQLTDEISSRNSELEATKATLIQHGARVEALVQELTAARQFIDKQQVELIRLAQEQGGATQRAATVESTLQQSREEISEARARITEHEGKVAGLDKALHERDAELARVNKALTELTNTLAQAQADLEVRQQILAERDSQVTALSEAVSERENQLAELQNSLQSQQEAVAKREAELAQVKEALAERTNALAQVHAGLETQQQILVEREERIVQLNQTLAERDGRIAALNEAVAEREEQRSILDQTLTDRTEEIVTLNQALAERDKRIAEILYSTSWRVTAPLRSIKKALVAILKAPYYGRILIGKTARAVYRRLPLSYRNKERLKSLVYANFGFLIRNTATYQHWFRARESSRAHGVTARPTPTRPAPLVSTTTRAHHERNARLIADSGLFDTSYYLEHNPGVCKSGMDPLIHYIQRGAAEGRDPSPLFDSETYKRVAGISNSKQNPLVHFFVNGCVPTAGAYPNVDALIEIQTGVYQQAGLALLADTRQCSRRIAVFLQCGSDSCHEDWYRPTARSWDLVVNFFDDHYLNCIAGDLIFRQQGAGSKFTAFWCLIRDYPEIAWSYDYWMLMDDDLCTSMDDLERLFKIVIDENLDQAQPSLTHDSDCAWPVFKQVPESKIRRVNGVEIMSPILSRRALVLGKHLFAQTVSGWGLDLALGKIVRERLSTKPAVIDEIKVKHTKRIDTYTGSFYTFLQGVGISAKVEWQHMVRLYNTEAHFFELHAPDDE